jgi:hypothetical protein
MTQRHKRTSVYMTEREHTMMMMICNKTGESQSKLINALICKEYYQFNLSSAFSEKDKES